MLESIDLAPVASAADVENEDELLSLYPWLDGVEVGVLDPGLLAGDGTASLEAVAAHEPDLILTATWTVSEDLYQRMSDVAPTYVGRLIGNNDWDSLLTDLGSLTGRAEATAAALAEVDSAFGAAREQLPGLEGLTYSSLRFDGDGFGIGNGSWWEGLGLVPASYQDNTQGDSERISLENLSDLDSDVMSVWFWQGSMEDLSADPRFEELPSVASSAFLEIDLRLAYATNSPGPNSLAYVIDWVVPRLLESDYA